MSHYNKPSTSVPNGNQFDRQTMRSAMEYQGFRIGSGRRNTGVQETPGHILVTQSIVVRAPSDGYWGRELTGKEKRKRNNAVAIFVGQPNLIQSEPGPCIPKRGARSRLAPNNYEDLLLIHGTAVSSRSRALTL